MAASPTRRSLTIPTATTWSCTSTSSRPGTREWLTPLGASAAEALPSARKSHWHTPHPGLPRFSAHVSLSRVPYRVYYRIPAIQRDDQASFIEESHALRRLWNRASAGSRVLRGVRRDIESRVRIVRQQCQPPCQILWIVRRRHWLKRLARLASDPPSRISAATSPRAFVGGRYETRELLGEGGKKRVYRAHDTLLDREVAFALIKTDGLDQVGRERVRREARAMGRLGSHPNIVSVLDLGEDQGQPYLVTELMPGGDLTTLLQPLPSIACRSPRF